MAYRSACYTGIGLSSIGIVTSTISTRYKGGGQAQVNCIIYVVEDRQYNSEYATSLNYVGSLVFISRNARITLLVMVGTGTVT